MARYDAYASTKEKTLAKIESHLKFKTFKSSLPAAISKQEDLCAKLHASMVTSIMGQITEFSEEVEGQVQLKEHLEKLDKIVEDPENQLATGSWKPSRIPLDNQVSRIGNSVKRWRATIF